MLSKSIRLIAVSTALFSSIAYAENPKVGGAAMSEDKNIVENAVNSKDHTTLVAAVKAAGLVQTLQGKGPFTVFAPHPVKTVGGWVWTAKYEGSKLTLTDENGTVANVTIADVKQSNGVIHVIDKVLLPKM